MIGERTAESVATDYNLRNEIKKNQKFKVILIFHFFFSSIISGDDDISIFVIKKNERFDLFSFLSHLEKYKYF